MSEERAQGFIQENFFEALNLERLETKVSPEAMGLKYLRLAPDYLPFIKAEFYALDTESTGLLPEHDRLVEIAAVRYVKGCPEEIFSSLINPGRPIPLAAQAVNHISDEMVAEAPDEKEVLLDFLRFLRQSPGPIFVVAHNAKFDMEFLAAVLARHGQQLDLSYLDSLSEARALVPGLGSYSLATLCQFLKIDNPEAHRAASDALACGALMFKLLEAYEARL